MSTRKITKKVKVVELDSNRKKYIYNSDIEETTKKYYFTIENITYYFTTSENLIKNDYFIFNLLTNTLIDKNNNEISISTTAITGAIELTPWVDAPKWSDEYINIGALASNVFCSDGKTVEYKLSNLGGDYVEKAGDTMTGPLTTTALTVGSRVNENTTGTNSVAEGYNVTASGDYSHAEGFYTTAQRQSQHVEGTYNIADSTGADATEKGSYIHISGNGTASNARSNAYTLDWLGNAWFAGDVYINSTSGTNKDEGSKRLAIEDIAIIDVDIGTNDNNIFTVYNWEPGFYRIHPDKINNIAIKYTMINDLILTSADTDITSSFYCLIMGENDIATGGAISGDNLHYYIFTNSQMFRGDTIYLAGNSGSISEISTNLEKTSNKVTSLSSSSTDIQYPSAKAVYDEITSRISTVYKAKGTCTFANKGTLIAENEGNVYNISDAFTTTSDFVEGSGKSYPAGTNIVIINTATSGSAIYKYDVLAGMVEAAPINHASTATTYGVGTTANYGHCKTINDLTQSSYVDGEALSAYQGYLLNQYSVIKNIGDITLVDGSNEPINSLTKNRFYYVNSMTINGSNIISYSGAGYNFLGHPFLIYLSNVSGCNFYIFPLISTGTFMDTASGRFGLQVIVKYVSGAWTIVKFYQRASTTDLTAGSSALDTNCLYYVYE